MKLLITTQAVDKNDPILGFFHGWLLEFAKHFEHVEVICLREGEHALPANVSVHSLGKENGENRCMYVYRFYRYFWNVYMHNHVDFVFFHMGAIYNILALPFFLIRKIKQTKFYWWKAHGHINMAGKIASQCVDKIYTASKESFPIDTKKRIVIGHAIDTTFFSFIQKEKITYLNIVCVGRISRVKKFERVIELGSILRARNIPFHAVVVGDVIDVVYMNQLRDMISTCALSNDIEFIGPKTQEEIVDVYKKANILIHPSETGSIDKAVLEAMSVGIIPIALCGAYGSLLGKNGLCVEQNEAIAYGRIIEDILANTEQYHRLTNDMRETVIHKHSLNTLTKRIFEI